MLLIANKPSPKRKGSKGQVETAEISNRIFGGNRSKAGPVPLHFLLIFYDILRIDRTVIVTSDMALRREDAGRFASE